MYGTGDEVIHNYITVFIITDCLSWTDTCAGDDHVSLSDHLIQFNHSEAVHAERAQKREESV